MSTLLRWEDHPTTAPVLTWEALHARYHVYRLRQHHRFYARTTRADDPPPLLVSDTCWTCGKVWGSIECGPCLIERLVWTRDLTWADLGLGPGGEILTGKEKTRKIPTEIV